MQCMDQSCPAQTADGLDVLVAMKGISYVAADRLAASQIGHAPNPAAAMRRELDRKLLNLWITMCLTPWSVLEHRVASRLEQAGMRASMCTFSGTALNHQKIKQLIAIGVESGATVSDSLLNNPPQSAFAYCVQSVPHTIDRIVIMQKGRDYDIVWNDRKAGFSGLIGLGLGEPKYLAANKMRALELQEKLNRSGYVGEVASAFRDMGSTNDVGMWSLDRPMMQAIYATKEDVLGLDRAITAFAGMERVVQCIPETMLDSAQVRPGVWFRTRRAFIRHLTPPNASRVSADASSLFELTGSRADDALWIMQSFATSGLPHLASDFKRLAENRVIHRERNVVVREAVNEYQLSGPNGDSMVANFVIRPEAMVLFKERNGEVYYRSRLHYGAKVTEVMISQAALEAPKNLKDELVARVVTSSESAESLIVPTVIDLNVMKSKVLPYLRAQTARLPSTDGISSLGWNAHRTAFITPGRIVAMDGVHRIPAIFHPALPALRTFRDVSDWSEAYPPYVHPDCQAVISILLALTVRYYRRCALRPASIKQTSESSRIVERLAAAIGQEVLHEMGHNQRERMDVEGVRGYPFVATGFGQGQLLNANVPYLILTDRGVVLDASVDDSQIEQAGRALQCALVRVVGWCLATGADDFKEVPSADYNTSLMEEGRWLVENVCKLQKWETRSSGFPYLEALLGGIPESQSAKYITLLDGIRLRITIPNGYSGLNDLINEMSSSGWEPELDAAGRVSVTAAVAMPSICAYYGGQPPIEVEDSESATAP